MTQRYSYSKVDCFSQCPYKYKLRYIEKLQRIQIPTADNALLLGQALHTGIERGVERALETYQASFPILDNLQVNEMIKLESLIPKVQEILPIGECEIAVATEEYIGYIDYLSKTEKGVDLYDFKYSNNQEYYVKSSQLHVYKYYFEQMHRGLKVDNLYYVFIPKIKIRQKKSETVMTFRNRLKKEVKKAEIKLVKVEYDEAKVEAFLKQIKEIEECKDYTKNKTKLCEYCEYQGYCEKGEESMILPKNEKRNIEKISKKVIWIYGAPFSGKTTFASQFKDAININTDGNIKCVDTPFVAIKDEVEVDGRMTKRTLAWEKFKEVVAELEKKQNDFKTIIVDVLEHLYEHCRLYIYEQMGITHESDDSFRAWDKVRSEFLNTLKRLITLDYENVVLISHEDTSKDITKRGADKVTAIKPNIGEKIALQIAGMVDIVARVVADGEQRTLNFKSNEVIFGGGRLQTTAKEIALDVKELEKVYDEANKGIVGANNTRTEISNVEQEEKQEEQENERATRRVRR